MLPSLDTAICSLTTANLRRSRLLAPARGAVEEAAIEDKMPPGPGNCQWARLQIMRFLFWGSAITIQDLKCQHRVSRARCWHAIQTYNLRHFLFFDFVSGKQTEATGKCQYVESFGRGLDGSSLFRAVLIPQGHILLGTPPGAQVSLSSSCLSRVLLVVWIVLTGLYRMVLA